MQQMREMPLQVKIAKILRLDPIPIPLHPLRQMLRHVLSHCVVKGEWRMISWL